MNGLFSTPSPITNKKIGRIEIDKPIFSKREKSEIRVVINAAWRKSQGLTIKELVSNIEKLSVWKNMATLEDAHCTVCCADNSPIVELSYTGMIPTTEESEEVFVFSTKANCTSSRAHHGCKLLLVISIPKALEPLISVPVELHAKTSRSRVSKMPTKAKATNIVDNETANTECAVVPFPTRPRNFPPKKEDIYFSIPPAIMPGPIVIVAFWKSPDLSFFQGIQTSPDFDFRHFTVQIPDTTVVTGIVCYSTEGTIFFLRTAYKQFCSYLGRDILLPHSLCFCFGLASNYPELLAQI